MLWIGTADIKDLYIEVGKEKKPFLALVAQQIRRGVEVRLIHAKEPGPNFREDFDHYPVLYDRLERVLCPRVHFKMLVFDGKEVCVGSANLTGAGITQFFTDISITEENGIPYLNALYKGKKTICKRILRLDADRYQKGDLPLSNLLSKYCSFMVAGNRE